MRTTFVVAAMASALAAMAAPAMAQAPATAPIPATDVTLSQMQDFINAFQAAVTQGATEILCITISSKLSGTYQSATVAAEELEVPVHVFDTLAASLGIAMMLKRAAVMRDEGADSGAILAELERIRAAAGPGRGRRRRTELDQETSFRVR